MVCTNGYEQWLESSDQISKAHAEPSQGIHSCESPAVHVVYGIDFVCTMLRSFVKDIGDQILSLVREQQMHTDIVTVATSLCSFLFPPLKSVEAFGLSFEACSSRCTAEIAVCSLACPCMHLCPSTATLDHAVEYMAWSVAKHGNNWPE